MLLLSRLDGCTGQASRHSRWKTVPPLCMPCTLQGVTYQHTQGVVKNIIPAIASTNAIVAAACTLEALKTVTLCSTGMNNYMMWVSCRTPHSLLLLRSADVPSS